jgi:hypothetical protein
VKSTLHLPLFSIQVHWILVKVWLPRTTTISSAPVQLCRATTISRLLANIELDPSTLMKLVNNEADDFFWMRSDRPRRCGSDEMWSGCCCHWQPQNLLILSMENLKHPAWMTKSSHRDPHGRRQLMRVNSTNILDDGLWIGGKATTRDFGSESDTRRTQVHVPAVKDRYVLLAI